MHERHVTIFLTIAILAFCVVVFACGIYALQQSPSKDIEVATSHNGKRLAQFDEIVNRILASDAPA